MKKTNVNWVEIPAFTYFLKIEVPQRMVQLYGREGHPLPYTKIVPRGSDVETGCINMKTRVITLCDRYPDDSALQYAWLAGTQVHECLHDLNDFSCLQLGLEKSEAWLARLMNLFQDIFNEQSFCLRDKEYGGLLIASGEPLLKEALANQTTAPKFLSQFLNLMLLGHWEAIIGKLETVYQWHTMSISAADLLHSLGKNSKLDWHPPVRDEDYFNEAWGIGAEIWRTHSNFRKVELIRKLVSLFPEDEQDKGDCPQSLLGGQHDQGEPGDGQPQPGEPDDKPSAGQPDGSEPGNGLGSPLPKDFKAFQQQQQAAAQALMDKHDDKAEQHTQAAISLIGALTPYQNSRVIKPRDGKYLLEASSTQSSHLRKALQAFIRPVRHSIGEGRKVNVPTYARAKAWGKLAEMSFMQSNVREVVTPPKEYHFELVADVSGSMVSMGRHPASRLACAAAHRAFREHHISHSIRDSITLSLCASNDLTLEKSLNLIAGIDSHSTGDGDGYIESLPHLITMLRKTPKEVVLILLTDGVPYGVNAIGELLKAARIRTIALGIDIKQDDATGREGLKLLGRPVFATKANLGDMLGKAIIACIK